jgi:hypothetical protein
MIVTESDQSTEVASHIGRHSISKGLELIYVAVTITDSTTEYYICPHCRSALPGKAVDAGCTLRTVLSLLLVLQSGPADPTLPQEYK